LLSATTGLAPADHGIVGVAFYVPAIDALFDCHRDVAIGADGTARPAAEVALGPWSTVFTTLNGSVDCVAHPGGLATPPSRWCRALVTGARIVQPSADWNAMHIDPMAMVATVIEEVDATLAARRSTPLLAWAHLNID